MSTQERVSFTKTTIYKLFKLPLLSKIEIYSEVSTEGEPFKIVVNQDYFNREFDIGKKQSDL